MKRLTHHPHLALGGVALLAVFAALAVAYSISVPLFEGPDEDDHFRYVKYLADQRALPVQSFERGGGAAGHQGWHPPLYYGFAALVIAPIDTTDFEERLWRNPAASYHGDPACCGRNLYFHTRMEGFPYTRTTLAVHLARWLNIVFGMLTVAVIYVLMLTLLPGQKWLALAGSAVAAFNPTFLFASALVSNDAPLAAFCSLALLLSARILVQRAAPTLKNFAWLGLALALGILVKTTALGLVPFALGVGAYAAWRARDAKILLNAWLGILAPGALLTGWWFIRNQILYGDPMAYRLIYASAIFPREQPLTVNELLQINLPWLWQTFWGGPTPGDFPGILLWLLGALTALAGVGMVLFIAARLRAGARDELAVYALLAGWLAFILSAQLQFIRTSDGTDQGRYLFPALASFAVLFILGLNALWQRASIRASILCLASFALLALYVLFANTLPAYARPPRLDESILTRADTQLDANFSNWVALRGYALSPRVAQPGDRVNVTLYWQSLKSMRESYRVFVHLVNADGRVAGGKDVIPVRGAYATVLWQPGEWVQDTISFEVARAAVAGAYQVEVGLYPFGQPGKRLNLVNSAQDRLLLDGITIR